MQTTVFWPDLIVLAIIAISIIISFIRGFIKELISLLSWVFAAWIAFALSKPLSSLITFVEIESMRILIAFLIIFILMVFVGALVNYLVGRVVRKTPFSLPDRMLGVGFGFLRGFIIVVLLVFFAGLTPLPKDAWWKQSFTINQFEHAAVWFKELLPESIGKHFAFGDDIPKDPSAKESRLAVDMNEPRA